MKTRIRKIRVQIDSPFEDSFKGVNFALCSSTSNSISGKDYRQGSNWNLCREGLTYELVDHYEGSVYSTEYFDPNKTRVMAARFSYQAYSSNMLCGKEELSRFKEEMLTALRIIHHFEKIAKWPLSKLMLADSKSVDNKVGTIFVFFGDKRWQKSPHMLSLYTLLIRLGQNPEFRNFRSHNEFLAICKKLTNKKVRHPYNTKERDWPQLKAVYPHIRLIMRHFKKIFGDHPAKYFFIDGNDGEGIMMLCNGRCEDDRTYKRLSAVKKLYKA